LSEFIYKYRDYISLGICLLLSVILLNTNENPQIAKLRLKTALIGSVISQPFRFIPYTIRLYGENRKLNRELFSLNQENIRLMELEAENERLRQMLNFISQTEHHYIPAQVIGNNAGGSFNYILLDRGSADGVTKNSPVMSSKGLVGRLTAVDKMHSVCQLMLDIKFGLSVKVERNRIDGILHWDRGDLCRLDGIPQNMDIRAGDALITSGMGGIYPKGLAVGKIIKVQKQTGGLFQNIIVEPYTDFHRLEEVFVLIPQN